MALIISGDTKIPKNRQYRNYDLKGDFYDKFQKNINTSNFNKFLLKPSSSGVINENNINFDLIEVIYFLLDFLFAIETERNGDFLNLQTLSWNLTAIMKQYCYINNSNQFLHFLTESFLISDEMKSKIKEKYNINNTYGGSVNTPPTVNIN